MGDLWETHHLNDFGGVLGGVEDQKKNGFRGDYSTGPWWELVRTQRRTNFLSVSDLQIVLMIE